MFLKPVFVEKEGEDGMWRVIIFIYAQKASSGPSRRRPVKTKQKALENSRALNTCARRFELPTPWSVAKCSIQLSYAHIFFLLFASSLQR